MKAALLFSVLFLAGASWLPAYDSDAPAVRAGERALPSPVRITMVHLTHLDERRVQSVQLPIMRVEPGRMATVQLDGRRYQLSAEMGGPNRLSIRVNYAVLDARTREYRTVATRQAEVRPGQRVAIAAGQQEFRLTAEMVRAEDGQWMRYTGR